MATFVLRPAEPRHLAAQPTTVSRPPPLAPRQLYVWSLARFNDASFLPGALGLAAAGFAAVAAGTDATLVPLAAAWAVSAANDRDERLRELEFSAVRAWRSRDEAGAALAASRGLQEARTADAAIVGRAQALLNTIDAQAQP